MQVNPVTSYKPNFTGKGQRYIQIGRTLEPIHKVSAHSSPEPPKTFLGKVVDRLTNFDLVGMFFRTVVKVKHTLRDYFHKQG